MDYPQERCPWCTWTRRRPCRPPASSACPSPESTWRTQLRRKEGQRSDESGYQRVARARTVLGEEAGELREGQAHVGRGVVLQLHQRRQQLLLKGFLNTDNNRRTQSGRVEALQNVRARAYVADDTEHALAHAHKPTRTPRGEQGGATTAAQRNKRTAGVRGRSCWWRRRALRARTPCRPLRWWPLAD